MSYIHPALLARRPLDQKLATHHEAESAKLATADAKDQPQATSATVSDAPQRTPIAGISIDDRVLLDRSYNPWTFPAAIRERILYPVLAANIQPQVTCNTPLIDVVTLPCEQGLLLAISNFSLRPIKDFSLTIRNLPARRESNLRPHRTVASHHRERRSPNHNAARCDRLRHDRSLRLGKNFIVTAFPKNTGDGEPRVLGERGYNN